MAASGGSRPLRRRINPAGTSVMGAYSQGLSIPLGDTVLILTSGQIAADEAGKPLAPGDMAAQTQIVFEKLAAVLDAGGATLQDIVKVQIFLTDMSQRQAVSAVRDEYLNGIDPVSTLVEISKTVLDGCDIEIEAMAIVNQPGNEE